MAAFTPDMVGTGEIKYPGGPKLALLRGSLILIYQGLIIIIIIIIIYLSWSWATC